MHEGLRQSGAAMSFLTYCGLVALLIGVALVACGETGREPRREVMAEGVYHCPVLGAKILVSKSDAFVAFPDAPYFTVGYQKSPEGVVTFTPVPGHEASYRTCRLSRAKWLWTPEALVMREADGVKDHYFVWAKGEKGKGLRF